MGKAVGIIFCIIIGIAIFGLSMITDSVECSYTTNNCKMQSKIPGINYIINEIAFSPKEIKTVFCDKMYRPARSGKKAFFVLKMSVLDSNTDYTLGSFPKYALCKNSLEPIKDFTNGKRSYFKYSSGIGASNILGFILAALMFVVSIVILTSKPDTKTYDLEDDDVGES